MNQSYFDAVVLGDSLAGRIAAALLARHGCRLLQLRPATAAASSAWCFSSLLLERILEQLDGRAVLTQPQRFQYLREGVRLDFHGRNPFVEEVRREYPRDVETILGACSDLTALGDKLAALFWECGGLPLSGVKARWSFRTRCLRRGLPPGRLDKLFADHLEDIEPPAAASLLGGLLPALALTSAEHMSLAEAALLWHGAMRPTGVSPAGLDELLDRRYQQFHGEEGDLALLESITPGSRQPTRLRFKGGKQVATACLVLADGATINATLPPALAAVNATPPPPFSPISLGERVSPIIADQVLLAGSPPLRLGFSGPADQRRVTVESAGELPGQELASRLRALLPFAEIDADPAAGIVPSTVQPGLGNALRRAMPETGLIQCSSAVLPNLGSVGEVLVGLSVATAVQRRVKNGGG